MNVISPPTIIIRHRKENLNKCSLRGLEERSDFLFYRYPLEISAPYEGYILLTLDATIQLSPADSGSGLLLLDATWRYAQNMEKNIPHATTLKKRRLPSSLATAYPRRQTGCCDPKCGLASVEALYAAFVLMGRDAEGLLDNYHWKEDFLKKNSFLVTCHA